jgi:hypothetical protein
LVQKISRIRIYNALALHILLHGHKILTLRRNDKNFFRRTAWYSLSDHKRSEEILEELKVEPTDKKLQGYKSNSL